MTSQTWEQWLNAHRPVTDLSGTPTDDYVFIVAKTHHHNLMILDGTLNRWWDEYTGPTPPNIAPEEWEKMEWETWECDGIEFTTTGPFGLCYCTGKTRAMNGYAGSISEEMRQLGLQNGVYRIKLDFTTDGWAVIGEHTLLIPFETTD